MGNIKKQQLDYIIIGMFVVVIMVVSCIIYYSKDSMEHYISLIQENIEKRLLTECKVVIEMTSIEELQSYWVKEDMEKDSYKDLQLKLRRYAKENDLVYVYFLRIVDGYVQYIIDSDEEQDTQYGLDFFEEPYWLVLEAYKGSSVVNLIGDYQEGWEGLLSAYVPVFDNNGNIIAVVGIDISDEDIVARQKEVNRLSIITIVSSIVLGLSSFLLIVRFRRQAEASTQASIAKSQFLSRMSHEIRTPMNAIIGFCRMAKKDNVVEKKDEYLDNILVSADYLLELINAVLDISKIEAKKMILNTEKNSLHEMMANVKAILEPQVINKQQIFNISLSDDIPKYLYYDHTRLLQIIINLTSNAIKFTPEKGNISVKVSLIQKTEITCNLEFSVQDNGIGIAEEHISRLFESFEQVDGTITRKYGGTGLGLSIAKLFIEMMGGRISVKSKPNYGSTFTFNLWLDIVSEEEFPAEDDIVEEDNLDCSGMIFLVAEDNEINQIVVKDVLEDFGANVEFANDGGECIEMFTNNPEKYSIIFMDIQMPDVDGLEATRKIRTINTEIPIIAMTAETFQEDINNALNAGMNDHLGKPLDIREIKKSIKKAIKSKKDS